MKKTKEIKIMINKESKIYNEFNNSQLSNKLSNYILEQSRGVSLSDNIILNIYTNFQMTEEEKEKLVDEIRENYGLDVKENLLKLKHNILIQMGMLIIGLVLTLISHYINNDLYYIFNQFFYIFGWLMIYESISSLVFFNIKTIYQNKKYKSLIKAKIIFTESNE